VKRRGKCRAGTQLIYLFEVKLSMRTVSIEIPKVTAERKFVKYPIKMLSFSK